MWQLLVVAVVQVLLGQTHQVVLLVTVVLELHHPLLEVL
jgi:hypothetical protein